MSYKYGGRGTFVRLSNVKCGRWIGPLSEKSREQFGAGRSKCKRMVQDGTHGNTRKLYK